MSRPVAIVSGMVAGDPGQGGAAWAVLQYVLGLDGLGYDTLLVEPMRSVDEQPLPATAAARYFDAVVDRFGLAGRACLLRPQTGEVHGFDRLHLENAARRATLLLNVSGMLPLQGALHDIPTRAYLDLDPGFNQLWHVMDGIDMGFDGHTHHITVGLSLGDLGCAVPTCGITWIPTLPPVVMNAWPVAGDVMVNACTTVGHWRSYGSIDVDGKLYGQKAHSVRALLALARQSPMPIRPALDVHPDERADHTALAAAGWELIDPATVAATPDDYGDFVRGSWAEIGLAKSGYVASRSGWFSDRSACYLASGRPVIAQDTGFSRHLPTGEGLLAFDGVDEAVAAIEAVTIDYTGHRRAARQLAEQHLDSNVVLRTLLERMDAR